jgi:hypothetical protein
MHISIPAAKGRLFHASSLGLGMTERMCQGHLRGALRAFPWLRKSQVYYHDLQTRQENRQ